MGEAGPHLLPLSSPDTPSSPHILSSNLGSLSEGQAAGASLQNFRHCQELLWHASEDNKVLQGRLQSSIDRNTSFANQVGSCSEMPASLLLTAVISKSKITISSNSYNNINSNSNGIMLASD